MTFFFETYGCQMNVAESAALERILLERGWSQALSAEAASLVILNTCSVRATAERRVFGRIAHYRALKNNRPSDGSRAPALLIAGCMAERIPDKLRELGADFVMGTSARSTFEAVLDALEASKPLVETEETARFSFSPRHYAKAAFSSFVPIMHGCNNFCTYCIVPYVRGREVSRDPDSILSEIDFLEQQGVREITLLGQNVNSYRWEGEGRTVDFPTLLRLVAERVRGIRWIRFLSSHPKDIDSRTIAVMRDHPVYCRSLHLCVQHGSNRILSAMNRRYTRERYLELVDEIRSAIPDIALTTDILIGFPGETEDDLEQTLDLMREVRFSNAFMYHYNPREGTAAYSLPDRIDEDVKKERLARIIDLQLSHSAERMRERIGSTARVLVESVSRRNERELFGRTERDEMVVFPGELSLIGSFVDCNLSAMRGKTFRSKEAHPCPGV